jgi:serine protease Do
MRLNSVSAACIISLAATGAAPGRALLAAQPDDLASRQSQRRTPVVDVFEANRDAVVNIASTQIVEMRDPFGFDRLFDDFFQMPDRPRTRQYKRTSVGSGFVIHADGYIITNAHVVARTAERKAIFADGREYPAEIVATDPDHDLAVLKIQADRPLKILKFGRSDDLMIGETVIAIGNPLGYQHTVTAGVISALDRDLEFGGERTLSGLIQTDASINPGNSGGPLLNVLGELIGVNTAIRGDAQNIGFAIPIDHLRQTLPELLDVERRYRFVTGLVIDNRSKPPRVAGVATNSPAAAAGLRAGDAITAVNGHALHETVDFYIELLGRKAGDTIAMTLDRDGRKVTSELVLAPRAAPDALALARRKLGITVEPLPADIARELDLPGEGDAGLLITEVQPDGPAGSRGFEPRDIIIALDRHNATTIEELGQLLEYLDPDDAATLTVLRVNRGQIHMLRGTVRVR